jgi:ABC-2 type transport system ATP-binding protein
MNSFVQVDRLHKSYGPTIAVDEISFEVQEGEIFGMVGPNGAGKTTTVECIEGLRKQDRGTVRVMGLDPQRDFRALRTRIGIQLQHSNLPERMKVWEALDLYASFYSHSADWEKLITQLGLEDKRNAPFAKLSGGQKQRLFIALALLPDPQLVFLDELTTGLDPQARHSIWDLVREVRSKGMTVLLTTHYMEEAEQLCDRVAILNHGQVIALDTPDALVRKYGAGERVVFTVNGELPQEFITTISKVARIEIQGERVIVRGNSAQSVPLVAGVVMQLSHTGTSFRSLQTEQANLEDVFLTLTGREMHD